MCCWFGPFRREEKTYRRLKPTLLRLGLTGKWITIRGSEVLGIYDDPERAFDVAIEKLGLKLNRRVPFLMRKITERDESARIFVASPANQPVSN